MAPPGRPRGERARTTREATAPRLNGNSERAVARSIQSDEPLLDRLRPVAQERSRFDYKRLHVLLRR
jgi:hypothetical protein